MPDAIQRRSCRLGPHWVAVDSRGGKVTGVALGGRGSSDDRDLARDLEGVLRSGKAPAHLSADIADLPAFTRKVLARCARIQPGQVMTYSELARAVGHPKAARAVGQVMAKNPFALLIPCHRVVGSDYSLHGFGGGLDMKEWLLAYEGWQFEGGETGRRLKSKAKSQQPKAKARKSGPEATSERRGAKGLAGSRG
jgi:methylated-DNA-[protein]-cysteine S-methyltransferase